MTIEERLEVLPGRLVVSGGKNYYLVIHRVLAKWVVGYISPFDNIDSLYIYFCGGLGESITKLENRVKENKHLFED